MTEISVRQATINDLDAIAYLRSVGFGSNQADVRARLQKNPYYNYRHIIIAEVDGKPVGTACAFPAKMWLGGTPIPMGAVAAITTHPRYRLQGVANAMMLALLKRMADKGLAISTLFPVDHPLYYKYGYAAAALWHAYSIHPHNLPFFAEIEHVRPFAAADLPALRSLYRGNQLSGADGRLARSEAVWRWILVDGPRAAQNYSVVYDDGGVEGYLQYTITDANILKITEIVAHTDAAFRGLWAYAGAQPEIASVDYIAPADAPIFHLLNTPADSHGGNRGWVFNDVFHVTSSFMLRVVNLAQSLTTRFYPADMMGSRVLKIYDPQLPANEHPLRFRIVDGRAETELASNRAPHIETDIITFSKIYAGFLHPAMARRLGKLDADDASVAWLGQAMAARPLFIHPADWF